MSVQNANLDTALAEFDHPVLQISIDRPERRLVLALLDELDRLDIELQKALDNHHVETASSGVLERMGALTSTSRRDGESVENYRYRVIAEAAVKRIQPTFEELAPLVKLLLDCEYSDISFTTDLDANAATFEVTAPTSVWDDAPLQRSDIDHYIERALPLGHSFNRVET